MPEVNKEQFWKANPNQMALPGMEELSHPGATALSQGYHFEHHVNPYQAGLMAHDSEGVVSELHWRVRDGSGKGEIGWVHTIPSEHRQGLATALYGIGRRMAAVKPKHSDDRSFEGDRFAESSAAAYGGPVPRNRNIS
jgi:hypothetical protein